VLGFVEDARQGKLVTKEAGHERCMPEIGCITPTRGASHKAIM